MLLILNLPSLAFKQPRGNSCTQVRTILRILAQWVLWHDERESGHHTTGFSHTNHLFSSFMLLSLKLGRDKLRKLNEIDSGPDQNVKGWQQPHIANVAISYIHGHVSCSM